MAHSGTVSPAAGLKGSSAQSKTGGGTWRMVAAMLLSGTIGLVVIESGLQVELVVLLRCLSAHFRWNLPRAHE